MIDMPTYDVQMIQEHIYKESIIIQEANGIHYQMVEANLSIPNALASKSSIEPHLESIDLPGDTFEIKKPPKKKT